MMVEDGLMVMIHSLQLMWSVVILHQQGHHQRQKLKIGKIIIWYNKWDYNHHHSGIIVWDDLVIYTIQW